MSHLWSWLDRFLPPGPIVDGTRHSVLISFAGKLRYRGTEETRILSILREVNRDRCIPPLPERDILSLAAQAARRAPTVTDDGHPTIVDGPAPYSEEGLPEDVREARWLFLNDHCEWHRMLDEGDPGPIPCRRTTNV
jgi:hypothetical protein